MSDRLGRRPILVLSIFGTSCGYALFAIGISTANIPLLFLARALDGITGGNTAIAQAAIGDISTNENRAKNFGLIGAAFGLGFIFGPYFGGRLSAPGVSFYGLFQTPSWFGAAIPFWFLALLALANCLVMLGTFPETLVVKTERSRVKMTQAFSNVLNGFRSDRLRVVLVSTFLFYLGFTFFTTFFGVYLRNNFDFSSATTGDYFALIGLFIAFAQAFVVGRVAKKLADFKVLRFSFFGTSAMMLVYFLTPSSMPIYLYIVIPFFTVFTGLTMANMSSLISRSAEIGKQGEAMGIYSSVQSLAQVLASILVGHITSGIKSNAPLIVSSVCIGLAGFIFFTMFRPNIHQLSTVERSS